MAITNFPIKEHRLAVSPPEHFADLIVCAVEPDPDFDEPILEEAVFDRFDIHPAKMAHLITLSVVLDPVHFSHLLCCSKHAYRIAPRHPAEDGIGTNAAVVLALQDLPFDPSNHDWCSPFFGCCEDSFLTRRTPCIALGSLASAFLLSTKAQKKFDLQIHTRIVAPQPLQTFK